MCQINMESGRHKNGRQAEWGEEVHRPGAKEKVHDIESQVVPRVVTVRRLAGLRVLSTKSRPPHLSHGPWGASRGHIHVVPLKFSRSQDFEWGGEET